MNTTPPAPDPAELYVARLGTPHSQATARSALRTIACALGVETVDWAALTYADLSRVRASLNRLSPSWGNSVWSITRQVLLEGRRLGIIDAQLLDDVFALPRLRGSSGRLGRDIDQTEITALLAAADPNTTSGRRDGALLALLVAGGLRRNECVTVQADDWDAGRRVLRVMKAKGRKTREVPMPWWAAGLLDVWLREHPGDGQMLRSVDRWGNIGCRFTSDSVAYVLKQLCLRSGVAAVSAHAFRAHRITAIIAHGDPLVARNFAGHTSVSTTQVYDRRGLLALTRVVEELECDRKGPLRVAA